MAEKLETFQPYTRSEFLAFAAGYLGGIGIGLINLTIHAYMHKHLSPSPAEVVIPNALGSTAGITFGIASSALRHRRFTRQQSQQAAAAKEIAELNASLEA